MGHVSRMRIQILIRGGNELNAIDQASRMLAEALVAEGHDAAVVVWTPGRMKRDCAGTDLLVLPYNPFMWGRRGFAPRLVRDAFSMRRSHRRPRLALLVHEPYLPARDPRSLVLSIWQRAQLGSLLTLADERFASIEAWARKLSRLWPTRHLPSGSNVPDARNQRAIVRATLDIDHMFVVASLSTGHPSHLTSYVKAALTRMARLDIPLAFLQLGAGAADVRVPDGVRVVRPGAVTAEQLGGLVAAADVLLTPFIDGVSTRRGSFMAGLCQEVAVLGTSGELTDSMLLEEGLELVPVGRPDQYADRAAALALDQGALSRSARSGRQLFEREFTWGTIARRLVG